jgi:hypothetical protein
MGASLTKEDLDDLADSLSKYSWYNKYFTGSNRDENNLENESWPDTTETENQETENQEKDILDNELSLKDKIQYLEDKVNNLESRLLKLEQQKILII